MFGPVLVVVARLAGIAVVWPIGVPSVMVR
jgi:hypothetical protein